jgi:hypothetical protein
MEQAAGSMISAGIAASVAIVTALIATRSQFRRLEHEQGADREREREKKRIQYLDPLVISATDLLAKINKLKEELRTKEDFWKGTFQAIKTWDRNQREDFAFWCNGYGAGAVTTLYVTSLYFARASRIRSELPFIQLGPHDDQTLLNHLTEVREAFGGEHNLWVEIQDSLGAYVTEPEGKIMTYKGFCTQLIDTWDHIWFTRLIDFYRDIHMKQSELIRIPAALERLIAFAKQAAMPQQNSTRA